MTDAHPLLPQTRVLTVADYDLLPEDGPRHELIDGVLIEMPSPSTLHQWIFPGCSIRQWSPW